LPLRNCDVATTEAQNNKAQKEAKYRCKRNKLLRRRSLTELYELLQLQRPLQGLQSMATRHTERLIIDLACRHQIQDYIRSHSTKVDVSVNKLEALMKEGIWGVTNDSWSGQLSVCKKHLKFCWEEETVFSREWQ